MKTSAGSSKQSLMRQAGALLKSFREEREQILKEAKITSVQISAEAMVALKADMGIPWEKLKTMARYVKASKISIYIQDTTANK